MGAKEPIRQHLRLREIESDDYDGQTSTVDTANETDLETGAGEERGEKRFVRGRWQLLLAVVCVVGILGGTRLTHNRARESGNRSWNQSALSGTWELTTVGNDPVGPDKDSAVISQRVTFSDGKLHGETHLRGDAPATVALPFPDSSVRKVESSPDGHDLTVTWEGTYAVEDSGRIGLRVGKAAYFALGSWRNGGQTLQFDHDLILTYQGATRYQPVSAASQLAAFTR